ncbi:hypothetical protein VNO80_12211 [Phaseolus coccineus]|uniref:Malic enzyme N-terminal domain-containing protein n=1 Tax=Phaseolus coccineus TaxID=3886 RepID=A0AAN9NBL1_PHACN
MFFCRKCLPITIDVGTNNENLLNEELYTGLKHKRATGQEYVELLHEFMNTVKQNYGEKILVQFEDFANHNAFDLLEKYQSTHLVFNDDIQGTAAVVLEGLIAALKLVGGDLLDHSVIIHLFFFLQFMRPRTPDKKLIEEWVVPLKSIEDIYERFRMYCIGKLRSNPWSELDGLQPETKIINEQLERINIKGFLTINSQPAVNGEKSDSPTIGWGGPEGSWKSNVGQTDVNAVTWGVFPAKEIKQPTIVDPVSFNVWKDEAFEIWSRGWASLYPEGDASRKLVEELDARALIILVSQVGGTYFLVSLVDNDYINGDLFAVFADF